jgi:hypothetical protein
MYIIMFDDLPKKYLIYMICCNISLIAYRLVFQKEAYTRPMEDLRENCPFESFGRIPGKQRQAISFSFCISLFSKSLYYTNRFSFSRFLYYVAGRSLSALGRLVARKFTAMSTAMSPIHPRVRFVHPELKPQGGCPPLGKLLWIPRPVSF